MERAGIALRHGLGRSVPSPKCTFSLLSASCGLPLQRTAAVNYVVNTRTFTTMRLARSFPCSVPLVGQGRSLLHNTLFNKQNRSIISRNSQQRCMAQAADQALGGSPAPVIDRPAEASVGNEGTSAAGSSKAGGYPFAEIEPKWQRHGLPPTRHLAAQAEI